MKKQTRKFYYNAFFGLGIVFLIGGLASNDFKYFAFGAVIFTIGLVCKLKWERIKKWSEFSHKEKVNIILAIIAFIISFIIIRYFWFK